MITHGPRQTGTIQDRVAALRVVLAEIGATQLFAANDPGRAGARTGCTLELWMLSTGRIVIVQILAESQGLDVFYPSPSFTMNALVGEVRGYAVQGWDALRAGGSYRSPSPGTP